MGARIMGLEFAQQEYVNFLLGIALGFSLAAPPGPANAVIAYFSTNHSRLHGFLAGMGASSADAIILLLIFFTGFASILTDLAGKNLFLAGGIVMLIFAFIITRSLKAQNIGTYARYRSTISYIAGLATNISSPYTITWWLTVGLTLVTMFGLSVFGFFTALMIWNTFFPSVLAYSKKRLPKIQGYVTIFATITLSSFGIWFLLRYVVG